MEQSQLVHGSGQMRAQSISIQVSDREQCNAGCRFCISRTTPGTANVDRKSVKTCDMRRLRVGLGYAKQLGATHAILTGRADPTQEYEQYLCDLVSAAREYLPLVDMHTNGSLMLPGNPGQNLLKKLRDAGLTMITLSIAHQDQEKNRRLMAQKASAAGLIPIARDLGLLVRVSLVVNQKGVATLQELVDYIQAMGNLGAQMVVVREVWRPETYGDLNKVVADWNYENRIDIGPLQEDFHQIARDRRNTYGLREGNPLPWGTPVFLMGGVFKDPTHGVNITFARCEEANVGSVIKSIVHKPDGHGYRNWDHNGDILY
jgi:molybdenum cofactor biosynthesis enzyme MoaA